MPPSSLPPGLSLVKSQRDALSSSKCLIYVLKYITSYPKPFLIQAFPKASLTSSTLGVKTRREDAAATTEALMAHRAIKKIEFLGSRAVGNIVGQVTAKCTKPVFMELGGQSPAIVLDDAKLEHAAHICLVGRK